MGALTTFTTPAGEEMVVLPRTEYERLIETISDVAAYDAAKRRLASGEEELVPAEVVDRMLAGEHPVRAWRRHRGLTLERLADMAGLSKGYLSQIETGQRNGTVEKLRPIADALNLTLDDLT